MSSFFSSGSVDVNVFDRNKLGEGTYRVRLVDAADHMGAFKGSRTQFDFTVVKGKNSIGVRKGHIVGHTADAPWKLAKARGEIAATLGAFMGMPRDVSGLKVNPETYADNTRTLTYVEEGKRVGSMSRPAEELPLVAAGAEAILVVKPYFDKTGNRKRNPKTGQLSVVYDFYPLSSGFVADEPNGSTDAAEDDLPPAEASNETADAPATDALEAAVADGWKINPNAPTFYYKRGEAKQYKEDALRALYAG